MGLRFNDLGIRKKIFLVLGAVILFCGTVIAVSIFHMLWMYNSARKIYQETVVEAQTLLKVKADLELVRQSVLALMLEKDRKNIDGRLLAIKDVSGVIDRQISHLLSYQGFPASLKSEPGNLARIWESFKNTRDREIIPAYMKGDQEKAARLVTGIQDKRFEELQRINALLIGHANEGTVEARRLVEEAFSRSVLLNLALAVIGLSASAVFGISFAKSTARRFASILDSVERFKSGDFKTTVEVRGKDELGVLEGSLNEMFSRLYESKVAQEQFFEIVSWDLENDRKKTAELVASRERFRSLVESMSDWVWEIDKDGVYTYASPRVYDLLGYRPEEVIGKTPFDLMPSGEAEMVWSLFQPILDERKPFTCLENVNMHKDGRFVVLETSGAPFYDEAGAFLGYRGIDRDITKRKQAEQERALIQEQLLHSERMASIGEFAAGVAHEINNPASFVGSNLNTLSGYVEEFMDLLDRYRNTVELFNQGKTGEARNNNRLIAAMIKENDAEFIKRDIFNIVSESKDGLKRISSIVRGLKDFSRSNDEQMSLANLNDCVENALKLCWHELKYNAQVEKDLGCLPPFYCKPNQLTQVLINLLVNASQALKGYGKISISTRQDRALAVIEVEDNGVGIPEGIIKRIFDPFFTTKPVGKGTGLGLSIAYGIIKDHKGAIEVKSTPGQGTLFRVSLPIIKNIVQA